MGAADVGEDVAVAVPEGPADQRAEHRDRDRQVATHGGAGPLAERGPGGVGRAE
ncbi:MAG: hypothetical protein ACRDRH_29020 [Pseudonocardia sp.]